MKGESIPEMRNSELKWARMEQVAELAWGKVSDVEVGMAMMSALIQWGDGKIPSSLPMFLFSFKFPP
jgi:hypothetical protein